MTLLHEYNASLESEVFSNIELDKEKMKVYATCRLTGIEQAQSIAKAVGLIVSANEYHREGVDIYLF